MAEPLVSQHNIDETKKEELMDPDMEAAAKQLMQLSGDEDKAEADTTAKEDDGQSHQIEMTTCSSSSSSCSSKKIITSNLFVKAVPYKKRKYRSIHHLYSATTPFHGKKVIRS